MACGNGKPANVFDRFLNRRQLRSQHLPDVRRQTLRERMSIMADRGFLATGTIVKQLAIVFGTSPLLEVNPPAVQNSASMPALRRFGAQPAHTILKLLNEFVPRLNNPHQLIADIVRAHSFGRLAESFFTIAAGRDQIVEGFDLFFVSVHMH
jgi:hypothetical protein